MLKELLLLSLGSVFVLPWLRRRVLRDCVSVLMYHEVVADDTQIEAWTAVRRSDFLRQLDYLQQHYDLLTMNAAMARLTATPAGGAERPAAVLTFDDGNVGNLDIMLPIVEERRVPVTVYVATGHVETGRGYWFDRLVNALQGMPGTCLNLRRHGLQCYNINFRSGAGNWAEYHRLLLALKAQRPGRREEIVEDIVARAPKAERRGQLLPLSVEGVRRLGASPQVTLGAHSHGHELLPQVGVEVARQSITHCRQLIESWSGRPVGHFAYPSGDYDEASVALVRDLGFATAVATDPGLWRRPTSPWRIPRIAVGRYDSMSAFKINLIGGLRLLPRHLSM
jgi:peptidoglycan/xylan/chitin deacetylase (PgdA/CDA1 family)